MNWKSFKEYIPYLSGLIILLGLIRQFIYYKHFKIEIQNYIGISELLLAWVDESIFLIYYLLLIFFTTRNHSNKISFEPFDSKKSFLIFSSIGSFLAFVIAFFIKNQFLTAMYLAIIFVPIAFGPIYFLVDKICQYFYKENLRVLTFKIFYLSFFTVLLLGILTKGNIQSAKEGRYTNTKIYTKDSTYVSDSLHYFIGKTEKYYFIFNKDKKSTLAIPEREVSKFELHQNMAWFIPLK